MNIRLMMQSHPTHINVALRMAAFPIRPRSHFAGGYRDLVQVLLKTLN